MRRYDDEFLLNELKRFYNIYGRSPTYNDFVTNKNFPCTNAYQKHFGTWNNALQLAGLNINHMQVKLIGNEYCEICKSKKSSHWYYKNDLRICDKCYTGNRNYLYGRLNPNSTTGIGVITEHVVYTVLNDCVKCNTEDNFCAQYDLISKKYGNINVKSSKIKKVNNENSFYWQFSKTSKIPDYYICIGFNKTKTEILKVWIINSKILINTKNRIYISNSEKGLNKFKQFEVDLEPYNNVYQNLDITTLPEFTNVVI